MSDIANAVTGARGTVTVVTGTVGMGVAEKLDLFNGVLASISLSLGIMVGIMVLVIRWREFRAYKEVEQDDEG
jgi:hypothetical protein